MRRLLTKTFYITCSFLFCPCLFAEAKEASLVDAFQQALQNSPRWQLAIEELNSQRQTAERSKGLLKPQIHFSASYFQEHLDQDGEPSDRYDSQNYQIQLRQALVQFDGYHAFKRDQLVVLQAELNHQAALQQLQLDIADAYFAVLRADDHLRFATAEESALQRQLEQSQQRHEVGLSAITDKYESQAAYDSAVATRISAENDLSVAYEALDALTDQSFRSLHSLRDDIVLTPLNDIDTWTALAEDNNVELRSARLSTEIQRRDYRATVGISRPSVDLVARYQHSSSGGQFGAGPFASDIPDSTSSSIGVELTVPIYAGGAAKARAAQSKYAEQAAVQQAKTTARQTRQQVRSLFRSVNAHIKRIEARKKAITSADSAYDASVAGYEAGTRNLVDVLNSQRNVFAAKRDYANARYDYFLDYLRLQDVSGQFTESTLADLDKVAFE